VAQFSLVAMTSSTLLAVPNVSEGRDPRLIAAIGQAFTDVAGTESRSGRQEDPAPDGVRLLDVHSDPDHHRSVFTLVGGRKVLADSLLRGVRAAVERIDLGARLLGSRPDIGQHPYVGAVDVVPVVYLDARARGAACGEALVVADRISEELDLPVFLYGELTGANGESPVTRAELRRGGVAGLAERIAGGLRPDFGPPRMHPRAGATLVAARPPLVAFNLQLAHPATVADARRIAALVREGGGEGLPGMRAIGLVVGAGVAQVSMNVERPLELPLGAVVQAVRRHAAVASGELVGLAPRAAMEGFPEDVPLPGFDPARQVIENALGS